jgi:membrane protease YdiL (CAAX protease family)
MGLATVWLVLALAWTAWLLRPASRSLALPPQRRRAVPWGGLEVLLAFLLGQFLPWLVADALHIIGFFGWVYGADFQADLTAGTIEANDKLRVSLWARDLAMPLGVGSIAALLWTLSGSRPYQLGLTTGRFAQNVVLGALSAVCVVPPVYLVMYAVNGLLRGLGESPEEHPLTKLVFRGIMQPWFRTRSWAGWLGIAAALFLALALRWTGLSKGWEKHGWAGAWPELLPAAFVLVMVPGYLLVRARLPAAAGAIYATSLLFAAGHSFALSHPVPLFVLSLALGLLRYRTQSLAPSVVTHGLFNAVAWVILLSSQTADKHEKGKEVTDARARPVLVSTSSAVPGSSLPRRTYAIAIAEPSAGE